MILALVRRVEIAADVDLVGEVMRVVGKGRKVREVPLKGGTLEAVRAWLRCRGEEPGPLVGPVRKRGKVSLDAIAPAAVVRNREKRGKEAGL